MHAQANQLQTEGKQEKIPERFGEKKRGQVGK